jgi:MraZ protein
LYTQDEWQRQAGELAGQSFTDADTRRSQRLLFSGAEEVLPDKVGRITIPEFLRLEVQITDGVIFAGAGNRIEISSSDNWKEFLGRNLQDRQP